MAWPGLVPGLWLPQLYEELSSEVADYTGEEEVGRWGEAREGGESQGKFKRGQER